jgi:hypothetical protein
MYGALFHEGQRRPIIGQDYLNILQKHRPGLQWDAESEEAVLEFVDDNNAVGEIWYPTLYSIRYAVPLGLLESKLIA